MQILTNTRPTSQLADTFHIVSSAVAGLSTTTKTLILMLLATTGRMACFALPQIQPVTAICILAGIYLGWRAATSIGFGAALMSNVYLGQGAWTLEQGFCWALVGCVAWLLSRAIKLQNHKFVLLGVGILLSILFGVVMDMFWAYPILLTGSSTTFIAILGAGISFNIMHASGTVLFLLGYCAISQGFKQVVR